MKPLALIFVLTLLSAAASLAESPSVKIVEKDGRFLVGEHQVMLSAVTHKHTRIQKDQKKKHEGTALKIVIKAAQDDFEYRVPLFFTPTTFDLTAAWPTKDKEKLLIRLSDSNIVAHVYLEYDAKNTPQAHLIPAERDKGLSFANGDITYQENIGRFRSGAKVRFPMVDDVNFRESAPKGKVIRRLHREDPLFALLDDGTFTSGNNGDKRGVVANSLLSSLMPLVDPTQGDWVVIGEKEALHFGLSAADLKTLGQFRDDLYAIKTTKDLCGTLPKLAKYEAPKKMMDLYEQAPEGMPEMLWRLSTIVPGYGVTYMGEMSAVFDINYTAYVAPLKSERASVDVLRAAQALKSPVVMFYWEEGCAKPNKALKSLKLLKRSWAKAPACLKGMVEESIKQSLSSWMAKGCYCDSKAQALKEMKQLQKEIQTTAFESSKMTFEESFKDAKFNDQCKE